MFCFVFLFLFFHPDRHEWNKKKTRMTTTKQKGKKRDKKKKEDSSFFCVIAIYTADWYYDMQISLNHSGRHSARSLTPNRFHLIFDFVAFSEVNSVCCCCCCFDRHRTSKDTVVTRHFLTYNQQREMARKKKDPLRFECVYHLVSNFKSKHFKFHFVSKNRKFKKKGNFNSVLLKVSRGCYKKMFFTK